MMVAMTITNPEISIIIPVYNTYDYLEKCLESVRNQTFQNWEAICVNDGSTDQSANILQNFTQKDPRFKIFIKKNEGVSSARNMGLMQTAGKYIMFLDSDDFIHPQCMEIAYKTITQTKADFCDFGLQKTEEKQNISYTKYADLPKIKLIEHPLRKIINGSINASLLSFSKKLYKAELAKKTKFLPIPVGEDILYSLEIMDYTEKCAQIPNILFYYLQRSSSVTHENNKIKRYGQKQLMSEHLIVIIRRLCKKYSQTDYEKELQHYLSRYLFKVYIRRIFKLHMPNMVEQLETNMQFLKTSEADGCFNSKHLNLRFKLMFCLLQHKHYRLASILA